MQFHNPHTAFTDGGATAGSEDGTIFRKGLAFRVSGSATSSLLTVKQTERLSPRILEQ
jgi:hypothetical protein